MPTAPNPRPLGRYSATVEDGQQHYCCQDHPGAPLISLPEGPDADAAAITDAIREHDRQQHEEDPVV